MYVERCLVGGGVNANFIPDVERCLAGGGVNANFIPEQISWIEGQEMEGQGSQ